MNVLIVTGGSSSEREISLRSARAVGAALKENGHQVEIFDFKEGISALKKIISTCDIVFPVMHGKEGEDGALYSLLGSMKKPFVGSSPKGAKIAFDKVLFKKYCVKKRIRTAEWKIIASARGITTFGFPSVLKAASGGSSHEVALLHAEKNLSDAKVKDILKLKDRFYVERMLSGIEITVGILFDKALPTIEITPPEGGWFDYENKYSGKSGEIPFAPSIPEKIQRDAQKIALAIHKDLKLGSYSRSDFIVEDGTLYILEANTPGGVGMTTESLFPKAAKAAGMSFGDLLEHVIRKARRW